MATISRSAAAAAVLVETAAYGGAAAVISGQSYVNTSDVDLETSGYFGSHVFVEFQGNNVKDSLIVDVFASLDGSIYDTEPLQHHQLQSDGTPQAFSFVVLDVLHFRLGVKSSDTNTEFEYQITHQAWNQSNA